MALLSYLLPIFFILLGFGEILRIKYQLSVSAGIIDLVIVLVVIIWLFYVKKTKYFLKIPILIFILTSFLSLLINFNNFQINQLFISSLYLIRFIFYSSLYFVFVNLGKYYKTLVTKYMFFSGLIFMMIGFFQYFFFSSLKPFYYLGWDMHEKRLFSTFFDPNFAGVFLVLILIFVFILKDKIFPKDWVLIPNLFLIINFMAIILTYSRGAYLMLVICSLTYSIITKKWKIFSSLIISLALIFIILAPKYNFESTNLLRVASIGTRIDSMQEAVYIFENKPLGVGFNTYRYAKSQFGYGENKGNMISHAGAGVDNSFLFVLATTGIIGFISYLYLIFKLFNLGLPSVVKNKYALVLVVSLSGLVVNALTINSLFYSYIIIWVFILAGITESSLRE